MFSNKMDFSSCVIWIDFYKSGHKYDVSKTTLMTECTMDLSYLWGPDKGCIILILATSGSLAIF